jgi:hypothetical protein
MSIRAQSRFIKHRLATTPKKAAAPLAFSAEVACSEKLHPHRAKLNLGRFGEIYVCRTQLCSCRFAYLQLGKAPE